jgi:hypothetical protein
MYALLKLMASNEAKRQRSLLPFRNDVSSLDLACPTPTRSASEARTHTNPKRWLALRAGLRGACSPR